MSSNGVSKSEGLSIIAPYLSNADGYYVIDAVPGQHGDILDGWMVQVLIGQTIITANNGILQIDAFPSNGEAREVIQRSLNTAVALGMFTFDRGTISPADADPTDVEAARQGIEHAKRRVEAEQRLMRELLARMTEGGDGPSLSPGAVDRLHGMVQVDAGDGPAPLTGMYV